MMVYEAVAYDRYEHPRTVYIAEDLFPRIAAGDRAAFRTLYEQAENAVYTMALSILRNREDAEDAMQETFLKIRGAAHLYSPRGKPMAWVLTITKNICLMKLRQRGHSAELPTENIAGDAGLEQIQNAEDRIVLETAFGVLGEVECRIILLHAVTGLKHREIAELLDLPISTVLSKYNRGIKKLRRELEGRL